MSSTCQLDRQGDGIPAKMFQTLSDVQGFGGKQICNTRHVICFDGTLANIGFEAVLRQRCSVVQIVCRPSAMTSLTFYLIAWLLQATKHWCTLGGAMFSLCVMLRCFTSAKAKKTKSMRQQQEQQMQQAQIHKQKKLEEMGIIKLTRKAVEQHHSLIVTLQIALAVFGVDMLDVTDWNI